MNRFRTALGFLSLALTLLVVIPAQAFPPSGYDNVSTTASISIYDPVDSSLLVETLTMVGDAVIWRGDEYDPGDGRMIVDTRLDTLLLSGYSLTYGDSVYATLNRSMPVATGQIQQVVAGQDFPAESYFNVFYLITIGPPAPNPPSPAGGAQGKLQYDLQSGVGKAMLASGRLSTSDRGVAKAPYTGPANKEDANAARQGGDNIASPTVIPALPYNDVGITTGYVNDYDEACPWVSTSPDVVYSFTPAVDTFIIIDLCGPETDYDTKVFVYENNINTLVACNDDACSNAQTQFISKIDCFAVTGGSRYYIIVDGYGGTFGMYDLLVDYCAGLPCVVDCPAGSSFENEPCGQDTNGGCNAAQPVFTPIQCGETICGTAWADSSTRDTDWYQLVLTQSMTVDFTVVCEFPGLIGLVEMNTPGSGDCADMTGALNPYSFKNACDTISISMSLGVGTHWLFVAPSEFTGYPCAQGPWDYVATVTCNPQITWVNPDSVHMQDTIYQIPPLGRVYKDPRKTPVINPAGDTVGWLWHEHRVDPPPGGNDTIPTTGWMDVIVGPNQPAPTQPPDETIQVDGEAIIQRGDPSVSPTSGKWEIPTEIVSMNLVGNSPMFGPVNLSLPQPAFGLTTSLTPNEFWPVESFFDVYYQVEFPQLGQVLAPLDILPHMATEGSSEKIPPEDLNLLDPNWHPVVDIQNPGQIAGWVRPIHWLPPRQDSAGACCDLSNGSCRITTAADCNPVHEVYQGNGTTCSPNPCQVPPPANDCFESVGQGTITLDTADNQCANGIQLALTSAFSPDTRIETDPPPYHDGQTIQTEMVQMELTAVDPNLGTVIIRERADRASTGGIQNTLTDGQGNFLSGDSFFDLYLEVELPDLGLLLNTGDATLRMEATIYNLPPDSAYFPPPDQPPLQLYDAFTGQLMGWLCHAQHVPGLPVPCSQPRGACCDTAAGTCRIADQVGCSGPTEVWQGSNTSCVPNPCIIGCELPPPGGLCLDGITGPGANGPGQVLCDQPFTFNIRLTNQTGQIIQAISNGFRVYSPEGACWTPITYDTAGGLASYFNLGVFLQPFSITGCGADTIGLGAVAMNGGLPDGYSDVVLEVTTQVSAVESGKTLCIDSTFWPPGNTWVWAMPNGGYIIPNWDGPHCVTICEQAPCPTGWTAGIDTIQFSTFDVDVYDPADTTVLLGTIVAYGVDMIVQRDAPFEVTPGFWRMNTTVLQFSGSGNSALFGTINIDLDPNYVSGGYIQQCDSCSDNPAESFFDIIWRITTSLPFPLDTLTGDTAKMHLPCSDGWNPGDPFTPPDGHEYNDPRKVPIYDASGQIIGYTMKRHAVNNQPPCTHWTPGLDTLQFSTFSIDVYNPADSTDFWGTMVAYGTQMIVQRGAPYEVSPNIWRMDTDILQLTGAGNSALFGPFTIGLDPNQPSGGFIEQCDSCNDGHAKSEFTVNYVITTTLPPPENQLTGSSLMGLPCSANWNPGEPFTPPNGHEYNDPRKVPVYDASGQLIGYTMKRHAVSDTPPCTHWTPGLDTILFSTFEIEYYAPGDTVTPADTLVAYGVNMVVERLAPFEDSPNIWQMKTKVLEFSGSGLSPILGAFQINLVPSAATDGFIRQCDSCDDNSAESELNIVYVITTNLPPPMDTVLSDTAKMVLPCSAGWNPGSPFGPPNGHSYVDPRKVPIYDAAGNLIGYIWKRHHVADTPNTNVGACCFGNTCVIAGQVECEQQGGVYQGNGTTCASNPCSAPVGACCIDAGCIQLTQAECAQAQGVYKGDGVLCDPEICLSCCNHDGLRGDCNCDGSLDVADLTCLVDYLFRSGPSPCCFEESDANGSGGIDVADLTYIVDYLFGGGQPPLPCILK